MITVEHHQNVAVLRLQQGKVNALDLELLDQLVAGLQDLQGSGAGALVVTGEGRAFSAGVDLARYVEGGPEYTGRLLRAMSIVFETLFSLPIPTVAAVNGAAIAGGCILACCCDRRLLAAGARMGATELTVGVAFPAAALEVLRYACGDRTEDVVLSAGLYQDQAAVDVGLAHEVVPPEDLSERALALAGELAARRSEPFRLAKLQLRRHVLARIAADASSLDPDVLEVWADPETVALARASLESRSR